MRPRPKEASCDNYSPDAAPRPRRPWSSGVSTSSRQWLQFGLCTSRTNLSTCNYYGQSANWESLRLNLWWIPPGPPGPRNSNPWELRICLSQTLLNSRLFVCVRVGLGLIDSIPTWFGILASRLLRSSGPKTHTGPSLLLRKSFGFDRFDNVSFWIWTPLLVIEGWFVDWPYCRRILIWTGQRSHN